MNSAKKRKITAIVTLSVLLVAVVATACILTIPNSYRGGEDVVPTNTAAYTIDKASLSSSNTAVAFVSIDEGDARVMFPTEIYVDKSENLSNTGYYFFGDFYWDGSSNTELWWWIYDSVFGSYKDSDISVANIGKDSNENRMNIVFKDYAINVGSTENVVSYDDSATEGANSKLSGNKFKNKYTKIRVNDAKNAYVRFDMTGQVQVDKGTYYFNSPHNNVGLFYEFWTKWSGSGNKGDKFQFDQNHTEADAMKHQMADGTGINTPKGYANANMVNITITVYDKSELYNAITNFENTIGTPSVNSTFISKIKTNYLQKREVTQTQIDNAKKYIENFTAIYNAVVNFKTKISNNETILNTINGSGNAYNRANNFINDNIISTYLDKSNTNDLSITDAQVTTAISAIDNYVFELDEIAPANPQGAYSGSPVDVSAYWSRYNSQYYNLSVNDVTSGWEIKNADNNKPKVYNLKISPKTEVSGSDGTKLKLHWADGKNNNFKSIGSYTVNPATFRVEGLQKVTQQFKNADYNINLESASQTGILNNDNFNGFVGHSENQKSIYLKIDAAGKDVSTIDWTGVTAGEPVAIKDVGTYTVYYKVTAPNHYDYPSSFAVEITKTTITLQFDTYNHTYGDTVLDSAGIVENMLTRTKIFDATTWGDAAKNYLNDIFTFSVEIPQGYIDTDGFVIVRATNYTVNCVMKENNPYANSIETFNIVDNSNRSAYVVNPKPVTIQWEPKPADEMYYDGSGEKRPGAKIVGEGNFVGTSTTALVVDIEGQGIHPDGSIVPLVNHEAIGAGKYIAKATCTNTNYMVDASCETTKEFDILQRPVKVELKNRTRTYAQATTAPEVWKIYMELFLNNLNDGVYVASTTVSDGITFIGGKQAAPTVFEIVLNITDSDYTSQNDAEKYYKVNEEGYDLTLNCIDKNYILTNDSKGAKFFVNPATIDLDLQAIATKVYNGADQEIVMTNNNNVVTLRGYEATHRESLEILYSDKVDGDYTSTPLKMRDYGSMEVYYKVSANNHIENVGHFTAQITRAHIYVDVTKTAGSTYGDKLPTSQWLIENLGIRWSWADGANAFDFSNELEFVLQNVTDRRAAIVGDYSVTYAFKDDAFSDNYIITWASESVNVGVYHVSPKTLYVDWEQTQENLGDFWDTLAGKENWSADGMKYTYDGNAPIVKPIAPDMYDGKENVVVIDDTNRDHISLSPITFTGAGKGSYTVTTSLTNLANSHNYIIANPSQTFEVVARRVEIYVKNQTATYGNAYTVPLGTALVSPTSADAMWAYASADAMTHFIGDHYSSYRLMSDAKRGENDPLVDAGEHAITVEPIADATGAIVDNYNVVIVKDGAPDDMQAIFEITPVDIHFMGRQFNIDFDNDDEKNYITTSQIKERISTSYRTPIDEFKVRMSDLYKKEDGVADVEFSAVTKFVDQTTEVTDPLEVGKYYVWVEIKHENAAGKSNYNTFTAKIQVNILTDWISIVISEGISDAQYKEETHSSQMIFDGLTFSAISGIPTEVGDEYKDFDAAYADLRQFVQDGNVTFFVGAGNTTDKMTLNGSIGNYSIYVEAKEGFKYQNFRFLARQGETHTSNIDAYTVGKRYIGINWGEMDEVYGEHSYEGNLSNSHSYTLTNVYPGDNVRVTVGYYMLVGSDNWQKVNGHVKNVGTYKAVLESVTHNDYQLPKEQADREIIFHVTPREMKIKALPRELTYGFSSNATRGGVNDFLNRAVTGETFYEIASDSTFSSFAYGESASNIFRFKIGGYTLAEGLEYLSADNYAIEVESISDNYTIESVDGALTVKKSSNVRYGQNQIAPKTYIGKDINVAPENVNANIILTGDGTSKLSNVGSGITVTYKLASDDDSKYSADYSVKLAGRYSVNIKVDAPNHEVTVFTVDFVVERANILINMDAATKTYGDTEQDLFDKDGTVNTFSDWLKKHCNITLTATDNSGKAITVEGIDKDFEFKVIQKGQGNGDALTVGSNPIGYYRVYHCNNEELARDKYIINYYQDPNLPESDEAKCNANAYYIEKREVRVNWTWNGAIDNDNHKFEYTNSAPDIKASITLVGASTATDVPTTSIARQSVADKERATAINVGTYTAKVEVDNSFALYEVLNNYRFTNDTFDFEIVAKKVTVVIKNQSFTYGAAQTKVGGWRGHVEYECADTLVGQPIELTVEATTDKQYYDVASYHIVGKNTSPNYDVTFKGQDSDNSYAIFEVTGASINITARMHTEYYSGKTYSVDVKSILADSGSYQIAGDMEWDDAVVTYKQSDGTYSDVIPDIEGVTGANGKDIEYKVQLANHVDQTGKLNIEVRPANIVVNISKGAASVYGENLLSSDKLFEMSKAELNKEQSSIEVDIRQIITLNVDATGKVNKGLYDIGYQLSSQYSGLYNVTLVGASEAYEVKAKVLTVKWNYQEPFVYDGNGHIVTATLEGVVGDDVVAIGNYQNNSGVDAKDYKAIAAGLTNANYDLDGTSTLDWKIAPKAIQIEWTAGDFTYNKEAHNLDTPTVKAGELVGSDTCNIKVEYDDNVNAGEHHVATATALNGNYTVANNTFEFAIKPAAINITWNEGALTYNGVDQAPTAVIAAGQLFGDDVCQIVISGAQKNAGKDYTATATLDNSNYTIVSGATKAFEIAPKAITFTWMEQTKNLTYTGEQQVPEAVAVGAVAGDTVEFEITVGNEGDGINVGEYTAVVKGVKANSNYVVDSTQQTSMSTNYTIAKGVNEFINLVAPDKTLDKLPWSGSDKPEAKWGNESLVVKYYTDAACTQEVTDINNAGEGTYWVVVSVAGTGNYDAISQTFEVVLEGGFNVVIVIIGAVASLALLAGALVVVILTNKKKQQGGAV